MKICFSSNIFNHHQKFLSDSFYRRAEEYHFIATMPMTDELNTLGYEKFENIPYLTNAYVDYESEEKALLQIKNSDVLITGSAPRKYYEAFLDNTKLLFHYSERINKRGEEPLKYIYRFFRMRLVDKLDSDAYLLCASAYAAADYNKYGLFINKTYKWGYFPQMRKYNDVEAIIKRKNRKKILWVGRFLNWKHPDDVIKVAKKLKDDGYDFKIDLCGTGIMKERLYNMAMSLGVTEKVSFLGAIPSNQVRSHMETAGIYLFTSDRYEGWGAVLNESMNSCCAVVASHAIGAVPYLLDNMKNGIVYHSGNIEELCESVKYLLDNPSEQERMGLAAYHTIVDEWNSDIAAERFMNLSEHILKGEGYPDLYDSGPCSKAEKIRDDWFEK